MVQSDVSQLQSCKRLHAAIARLPSSRSHSQSHATPFLLHLILLLQRFMSCLKIQAYAKRSISRLMIAGMVLSDVCVFLYAKGSHTQLSVLKRRCLIHTPQHNNSSISGAVTINHGMFRLLIMNKCLQFYVSALQLQIFKFLQGFTRTNREILGNLAHVQCCRCRCRFYRCCRCRCRLCRCCS